MKILLILFPPLFASVIQLLIGRKLPRKGDWLPILGITISWITALSLFIPTFFLKQTVPHISLSVDWAFGGGALGGVALGGGALGGGALGEAFKLGFFTDGLSIATLFMVTTVSLLIHIFSSGYMHGNPLYSRFFAQTSFFTFAMLGLVISDNLLFLFIFWELMGLCSYLLIGFYSWCPDVGYDRDAPRKAGMKAFLTTRVGDAALFVAIAILYSATGSFTFRGIHSAIANGAVSQSALLAASLLILLGAIGKSAQFPLHVWLPDAMEGPSPVSALIHAATMVAAGIYLVGRSISFGFFPESALIVTAGVGSFTALFAASMALAAMDFKKVLAYSTISQLGFMLASLGVGGWTPGLFHLVTHAFFKALLFLGSGSVLHAVHTRDMREMGGLKQKMPITYFTMLIGALALTGFPGFSGFFSKDEILAVSLGWGMKRGAAGYIPFLLLISATAFTAFYTFRMMILVFHGKPKDHHRFEHAHESSASMTVPLIILSLFAIASGWSWLRTPFESIVSLGGGALGGGALGSGALGGGEEEIPHSAHTVAMVLSIIVSLSGIGLAFIVYHFEKISAEIFTRGIIGRSIHKALVNLWWVDDFYLWLIKKVIEISKALGIFDRRVIDRIVDSFGTASVIVSKGAGIADFRGIDYVANGTADLIRDAGDKIRMIQTGRLGDYILGLMVAFIILVVWVAI